MRRPDLGAVIALSWALIAIGVTVVFGPKLGMRGWVWLGAHHLVCVVAVSHELWRSRRRRARASPSARARRGAGAAR